MTSADALAVAASFGIDVDGASATPLHGGYSNETVLVDARDGRYAVRRYGRLHVTRAAVAFEHAIAEHAARSMCEIVAPLRDARGRTIVTPPGGGIAAVMPYVDGTTGRRISRPRAPRRRCSRASIVRCTTCTSRAACGRRGSSARFRGCASASRASRPTRSSARALDWSALVVAVSSATVRVAPRARALPHVVVHGDPNPHNVVTASPGDVRALIDFDFAHETERIYDVGVLLDEFARDDDDGPLRVERIAPLVAAYAAEAPLSDDERALVPDAMLRHAATLAWYVATRHGERVPGDVGGAPRYAARVAEIERLAGAIREAAGA